MIDHSEYVGQCDGIVYGRQFADGASLPATIVKKTYTRVYAAVNAKYS